MAPTQQPGLVQQGESRDLKPPLGFLSVVKADIHAGLSCGRGSYHHPKRELSGASLVSDFLSVAVSQCYKRGWDKENQDKAACDL